jgi:hypothetical protein
MYGANGTCYTSEMTINRLGHVVWNLKGRKFKSAVLTTMLDGKFKR